MIAGVFEESGSWLGKKISRRIFRIADKRAWAWFIFFSWISSKSPFFAPHLNFPPHAGLTSLENLQSVPWYVCYHALSRWTVCHRIRGRVCSYIVCL
jgi:hypothetical protein